MIFKIYFFRQISKFCHFRSNAAVGNYSNTVWVYGGECVSSSRAFSDLWSFCPIRESWREHRLVGIKPENHEKPGKLSGAVMAASSKGLFLFGGLIFDQPGDLPLWFIHNPDTEERPDIITKKILKIFFC